MKKFFSFENITKTLIVIAFSQALKYLFFYFFGITFPNILKDPFNLYRLIYIIIITGFSIVLRKI
jgi:hypothetical protein